MNDRTARATTGTAGALQRCGSRMGSRRTWGSVVSAPARPSPGTVVTTKCDPIGSIPTVAFGGEGGTIGAAGYWAARQDGRSTT